MIHFLKYTRLYFTLSALVIIVGWLSIFTNGVNPSIDFTGGSTVVYKLDKSVGLQTLRDLFAKQGVKVLSLEKKNNVYTLHSAVIDEKKESIIRSELEKNAKVKAELLQYETVGPTIGKETVRKTIIASLIAILGILLYLTFAFKQIWYGVAAVIAMLHDLLVLIGTYSLVSHFFNAQIDTLFVTAMLTALSFSVHDTIVVFDTIREYRKSTSASMESIADRALTDTMVRSLNNSLTIMLMLVPLMLFGGETIRFFAAALLIGTVTGTYSSPFIATPLLVFFENRKK